MARTLILTPYDHGYLAALKDAISTTRDLKGRQVDVAHITLSAVTMAGVDFISSIGTVDSETKLIKELVSKKSMENWLECYVMSEKVFNPYLQDKTLSKLTKSEISSLLHLTLKILYGLKMNSGLLSFSEFSRFKALPIDLQYPVQMFFSELQTKKAILPVVIYDFEKKDIRRFWDVMNSNQYSNYKEAQAQIEYNDNLSVKTIRSIERAGKDLYQANKQILDLRENVLKAVPITSKVIDLFLGKLPGIGMEFLGSIVSDYLKLNKSIPIYNCNEIMVDLAAGYGLKRAPKD